jgi:RNA polymerase sigma-70 factor, ECF subfamily
VAVDRNRERDLLARLRKGDERAVADLVRAYEGQVFNLLYRMLGNRADAQDVAQEVFLAVVDSVDRFRGECSLSTWVFRIARNRCINRIKHNKSMRQGVTDPIDDVPEGHLPQEGGPARPDDAVGRAQVAQRVQRAISALPEVQRMVVVLRDLQGFEYEVISDVLELPLGTVKSRLFRARAALAESLSDLAGGGDLP